MVPFITAGLHNIYLYLKLSNALVHSADKKHRDLQDNGKESINSVSHWNASHAHKSK